MVWPLRVGERREWGREGGSGIGGERLREWGGEGRGRGNEEGRGEAKGVGRGRERPRE